MKQSRFQFSEPSLIALEFAENEGFVIDNNKKISNESAFTSLQIVAHWLFGREA